MTVDYTETKCADWLRQRGIEYTPERLNAMVITYRNNPHAQRDDAMRLLDAFQLSVGRPDGAK
ncbi:hypothetical protein EE88_21595 [Salmonella enterica]|nr:hypothetical protein [Salmonella enterica]